MIEQIAERSKKHFQRLNKNLFCLYNMFQNIIIIVMMIFAHKRQLLILSQRKSIK